MDTKDSIFRIYFTTNDWLDIKANRLNVAYTESGAHYTFWVPTEDDPILVAVFPAHAVLGVTNAENEA